VPLAVAPFGITTTIVNPGFFRTELLEPASVTYAEPSIEDYADRTAEQLKAKLAKALVTIASEAQPPRRFIAGTDAIATAEQKVADLQAQIDAYRDLSTSLAFDFAARTWGSILWMRVPYGSPGTRSRSRCVSRNSRTRVTKVPSSRTASPTTLRRGNAS